MDPMMGQGMLRSMQFNPGFYSRNLRIRQWQQYIYQTHLLIEQRKQKRKAETHKTVPCQAWKDTGRCNYGKRCKFAHGPEELRPVPKAQPKIFNNPRYRTALCIKYNAFGFCPYGDQCHFIHDPETIDLEKCLDRMSASLSPPQLSPKQTDVYPDNSSSSSSGMGSESTYLEQWRERNQLKLTSESESVSASESDLNWESESLQTESTGENDEEDETTMLAHDPFRTTGVSEEIEFKPLEFNALDDFLYVINPQSVLPKKQ